MNDDDSTCMQFIKLIKFITLKNAYVFNAYVFKKTKDEIVIHSDLVSKYTSQKFKDLALELNIT